MENGASSYLRYECRCSFHVIQKTVSNKNDLLLILHDDVII